MGAVSRLASMISRGPCVQRHCFSVGVQSRFHFADALIPPSFILKFSSNVMRNQLEFIHSQFVCQKIQILKDENLLKSDIYFPTSIVYLFHRNIRPHFPPRSLPPVDCRAWTPNSSVGWRRGPSAVVSRVRRPTQAPPQSLPNSSVPTDPDRGHTIIVVDILHKRMDRS